MLDNNQKYLIKLEKPELTTYQEEFLYCLTRFSIVLACTKSGKTFSHLWWLLEIAHGQNKQWYHNKIKKGMEFWWVAPISDQAEIAFNRMKANLTGLPGYKIHLTKKYIITPLGSIIRFKSADNPNSLYGENVYGAVFDEFTRAKKDAWLALRSTLTFTGGPCKFIGNYTGSKNWGYKMTKKANEENSSYSYFKVDAYQVVEAGILSMEEVEEARKDYPKQVFDTLYLVKESSSGNVLFSNEMLNDAFTNNFVEEGRERYISADVALHGSDLFVVCLWHGMVLKMVQTIEKCEADEVEAFLKECSRIWKVPRSNIVYDSDGNGSFLRGYLKNAKPFVNGGSPIRKKAKLKINYANLKTQCFYELSKALSSNQIYIEHNEFEEKIKEELEIIEKVDSGDDKTLKITSKKVMKEVLGRSPDFADAIMMRMYFNLIKKRTGTTFVNPQTYKNTRNQ